TFNLSAASVFEAGKPFSIAAWVYLPGAEDNVSVVNQTTTATDAKDEEDDDEGASKMNGVKIDVNARIPSFRLLARKSSLSVRGHSIQRLTAKTWTHLAFTYDGSRGQNGLAIYVNGKA